MKPPAILYKYVSVETARKIFLSQKIRFQSPLQYNDPFDTQWDALWPLSTKEAIEYDQLIMEQAIRDPSSWPNDISQRSRFALYKDWSRIQGLPKEQREKAIAEFVKVTTEKQGMPKKEAEYLRDIQRRLRLLCLTENERSILMWSHYGDQHRGVVLGFNTSLMEGGLQRPLERIKYHNELPRLVDHKEWSRAIAFGLQKSGLVGDHAIEWALTKHLDWAYEREWRFLTIAKQGAIGEYEDFLIPQDSLVELVIGCRTGKKESAELLSHVRTFAPDIQHYRVKQHASRFELNKLKLNT